MYYTQQSLDTNQSLSHSSSKEETVNHQLENRRREKVCALLNLS